MKRLRRRRKPTRTLGRTELDRAGGGGDLPFQTQMARGRLENLHLFDADGNPIPD